MRKEEEIIILFINIRKETNYSPLVDSTKPYY